MSEGSGRPPGYIRFNWTMVGVVFAILLQTAGMLVWGGKIDERVANLEKDGVSTKSLSETVARVDERTQALLVTTNRIDQRLDNQDKGR